MRTIAKIAMELLFIVALASFILAMVAVLSQVTGCDSFLVGQPPIKPPIKPLTPTQIITQAQTHLSFLADAGWIVLCVAIAGMIYGLITADKVVEHIAIIVGCAAAAVAGLSLAGEIALPYFVYTLAALVIVVIGGCGYYFYSRYKASAATVVPASTPK